MLEQDHLNMVTVLLGQCLSIVVVSCTIGLFQSYRCASVLGTYRWCFLPLQVFGAFIMAVDIYIRHADRTPVFYVVLGVGTATMIMYVILTRSEKLK